jgi:hypothetical protein
VDLRQHRAGGGVGRKPFFFEKKNQKTFTRLHPRRVTGTGAKGKVFLLLFLQKKKTLAYLPANQGRSAP